MAPGPRQVRQGHEDDLLGAGRKRPAGRDRLSEDAAEIIVWEPSTKAKTRAVPGALSHPAICRPVPEASWSAGKCPSCGEHGLPSTAPADVSDRSIDGSLFRGRLDHGVWERGNVSRCWLMMRRNRRGPSEAGIRRQ